MCDRTMESGNLDNENIQISERGVALVYEPNQEYILNGRRIRGDVHCQYNCRPIVEIIFKISGTLAFVRMLGFVGCKVNRPDTCTHATGAVQTWYHFLDKTPRLHPFM